MKHRTLFTRMLAAALVAATLLTTASLHAALIDNLDGYWHLDETSGNFADASDNGNALTPSGSPHGDGANGLINGTMVSKNGGTGGDWGERSNFGNYSKSDAFSAQVWVNLDSNPDGFQYYLGRGAGPDDAGNGWRISNNGATDDDGDVKDASIARILFTTDDGAWSQNSSDGTLAAGNGWTQLLFTYDGSGSLGGVNLYINGALDNNATVAPGDENPIHGDITGTADFGVGNRPDSPTNPVDGLLDEAAVWNRELTASEVESLWNEGNGVLIPEPTTLALLVLGMTALLARRRIRR
ncbi:MAG: LamG domain-containing protein [Thiohalospira sp.]